MNGAAGALAYLVGVFVVSRVLYLFASHLVVASKSPNRWLAAARGLTLGIQVGVVAGLISLVLPIVPFVVAETALLLLAGSVAFRRTDARALRWVPEYVLSTTLVGMLTASVLHAMLGA